MDIDLEEIFLFCQLCIIYREIGENERGISAIEKAVKINPNSEIVKKIFVNIYQTRELYSDFFNLLENFHLGY